MGEISASLHSLHEKVDQGFTRLNGRITTTEGRVTVVENDVATSRGALQVIKWISPMLGGVLGYVMARWVPK